MAGWGVRRPEDADVLGPEALAQEPSWGSGSRTQGKQSLGPRGKGAPGKLQALLGSGGVSLCLSTER